MDSRRAQVGVIESTPLRDSGIVVVVDYGMGNMGSIANMVKKAGSYAVVSSAPEDILRADRLILPGVGSFDTGMKNLRQMGCQEVLNRRVLLDRVPILGICLGMQLFTQSSEEGSEPGLGWLEARTIRFRLPTNVKIPHMGWDNVTVCKPSPLFDSPDMERRFYFVHSYHLQCNNPSDELTRTHYGYDFTSAVCKGNILGTQFHPEKSHRFGMEFFKSFLKWNPGSGG